MDGTRSPGGATDHPFRLYPSPLRGSFPHSSFHPGLSPGATFRPPLRGSTLLRTRFATEAGYVHFRLIRLATKPALKPLSMFTTAMLEAQLFNMPSSAVTPPSDAP